MNNLKNSIIDIAHNHYEYLMNLENVVGVGRGYKNINKINILEPCVHVLVKNKVDEKYLTKNNIIPKRYMGIKTDVLEVGTFKALNLEPVFPYKCRPLESGCVIGLQAKTLSGTIGCIVTKNILINHEDDESEDDEDNEENENKTTLVKEYYILTNNHVIVNINEFPIGTLIIQPSKSYNGIFPKDLVGVLDTFVPIELINNDKKPVNYVDCAIARITNKKYISNKIISFGTIKGVSIPELGMDVKKVGYKSGVTEGVITTLNATKTVEFLNGKSAFFKEQIIVELKVEDGDSGSALLTKNNEIVGLVMAGNTKKNTTCSNDINKVFEKLNVELYTG